MANEQGQGQGRQALVVGVIVVVRNTVHVAHKSVRVIQWSVHREMVVNKIWRCCWWCCTALVDHATSLEVRLSVTHIQSESLHSTSLTWLARTKNRRHYSFIPGIMSRLVPFHPVPSYLSSVHPSIPWTAKPRQGQPASQQTNLVAAGRWGDKALTVLLSFILSRCPSTPSPRESTSG